MDRQDVDAALKSKPQDISEVALLTGLSARLLVLTIAFVMLAELLIWTPSIAQFRKTYLEERIARAHLAMIAVSRFDDSMVSPELQDELLSQTGTHGIVLKLSDQRMLMVGADMPPKVDLMVDMMTASSIDWIMAAFSTLAQQENRVLSVSGIVPKNPGTGIDIILDEQPMRDAMLDYSQRILGLSVVISLFTAGLVFITLQWLMVRPVLRMADMLARFRRNPEGEAEEGMPSMRSDEIGVALRELRDMQQEVRAAFRQKTRLATLGSAVAKINHDLRNSLSTAVLAFDRLAEIDDPEVKRLSPRLYKAISRAIELCSQTLEYAGASDLSAKREMFHFSELIAEVSAEIREALPLTMPGDEADDRPSFNVINKVPFEICLAADRPQLFRALYNLAVNARQAGASQLVAECHVNDAGWAVIRLSDDGPGLSEEMADKLFQPFATTKDDGTGLGLVIVRDIITAHKGSVSVATSETGGAAFEIMLPGASVISLEDEDA